MQTLNFIALVAYMLTATMMISNIPVEGTIGLAKRKRNNAGGNPSCSYPADAGKCSGKITRYAYNCSTNKCTSFQYGGCGGNGNRYATKGSCEDICSREKPYCNQTEVPPTGKEVAASKWKKKKQHGRGHHLKTNYHYRRRHLYHGAPETTTVAPSEITAAMKKRQESATCAYPTDAGKCKGNITRYSYNCESNTCTSFIYGGCGGNSNRYPSKKSCERACKWEAVYCSETTAPQIKKDDPRWKRKRLRGRTVGNATEDESESNEEKSASTSMAGSDSTSTSESESSSSESDETTERTTTEKPTKKPKKEKKGEKMEESKEDDRKKSKDKEADVTATTPKPKKKKVKKKKEEKDDKEVTTSTKKKKEKQKEEKKGEEEDTTTTTAGTTTPKPQCKSTLLGLVCFNR